MPITVERHIADGFTLWWTDKDGYLRHDRFIGYSVTEAKKIVRRMYKEGR